MPNDEVKSIYSNGLVRFFRTGRGLPVLALWVRVILRKLSGAVFALHRLSAPGGVAKSDFNSYGQFVPVGFPAHPFVRCPAGHKNFSGRREPRPSVVRAKVPRISAGFRNHIRGKTGSAELGSPEMAAHFSCFCQAARVQIFAGLRGLGRRAPQALVLIAGLRARNGSNRAVGEVHGDFSLRSKKKKMTGSRERGKWDIAWGSGPD